MRSIVIRSKPAVFAAIVTIVIALAACTGSPTAMDPFSGVLTLALIRTLTGTDRTATEAKPEYREIVRRGESAVPFLEQVLLDPTENTDVRKHAARLLGTVGRFDEVFPILVLVVEDDRNYQSWHQFEAEVGIEILIRRQPMPQSLALSLLDHPDLPVRRAAVNALAEVGDCSVISRLQGILASEPSLTYSATRAIERIRQRRSC